MDDLGEDLNLQLPPSMQVPVTHEKPNSTMESLVQIKNEFSAKVQDAVAKGDSSKKRRYERQLKQFEDAIKATREGKAFNYGELTVPPGFAPIPLNNGRPIGGGGGGGAAAPKVSPPRSSAGPSLAPSTAAVAPKSPSRVPSASKQQKVEQNDDDDDEEFDENKLLEAGVLDDDDDDILAQLEREVDNEDDDHDVDIGGLDLEDDYINQQLKAVSNVLPKMPKNKMPGAEADLDEMNMHADLFNMGNRGGSSKLPNVKPQPQQPAQQQPKKQIGPLPAIKTPQQQPAVQPKRPPMTSNNKELATILERQRLFKEAALKAKQEGNTSVALVYLRHAKGFEQMITAAENGLPLDMTNLPVPPQLASKLSAATGAQGGKLQPPASSTRASLSPVKIEHKLIPGDRASVFKQLEEELIEQVNVATANYKQFRDMGDVSNSKKLYQIAEESIKDLSALRTAKAHNEQVPLYHYEKRSYQTIDCNSDLTDNDLELTIMRAVNLPLPKDFEPKHLTTYVKYEFPFPQEAVQTDKTNKQSGTLNPEYNQTFRIQIQRKQAKFVRLMNRKDLKLEIYYKAGLLKGDKLLATCLVKLQQLENTATIHDAFDLLEGRRQIGGKLELKIRIREPLLHQEVREMEHKWLIIDKFVKPNSPKREAEEKVSL